MRILYFHQYFITPKGAGGIRSYEFARRWVQAGHDVHVVTGTAFDPSLPENGETVIDGIQITTVGVTYRFEMGFIARLKAFLLYSLKASIIAINARNYDVIIATSTPLTVAIPAIIARWIVGRKVIFEVRDVWPDAAVDAGVLKNPAMIFLARLLERGAYHSANSIVPLSVGMQERIKKKGVPETKLTMIPNGSDTSKFRPGRDGNSLRQVHSADDKFIVLYAGSINLANNIEYLIEVADIMKENKKVEFWVVGEGSQYPYFKSEIKKRCLKNVVLYGLQPKQKMPCYTAAANVGVVTFIPEPVYYDNSPNKFFDYISAGIPVLFNRSTWLEKWLEDYENGWICDPHDPASMVERINMLVKNPSKCMRMGRQSRKLAEDVFSRDLLAEKYLQIMCRYANAKS